MGEAAAEDDGNNTIVLQVDMHCEGCKAKVKKAIKKLKGLELVEVNMKEQKVTIKGKLDPEEACDTVYKKSGKRTTLIYPDPKKLEEDRKKAAAAEAAAPAPKAEEAAPPPVPEVVVVLRVHMHCGACAKQIKKNILKMDGVKEVDEDVTSSVVRVRGKGIDPSKLCERVRKRSGKHCEVIPPPPEPEPKPEPKPEPEAEKKDDEKPSEAEKKDEKPSEAAEQKKDEKPSEAAEQKKDEKKPSEAAAAASGEEKKEEEAKPEAASAEPTPAEPDQTKKPDESGDSDAVKKDADPNESAAVAVAVAAATADADLDSVLDMRKYEYMPYNHNTISGYVYPPQLFSDENPNACSLM